MSLADQMAADVAQPAQPDNSKPTSLSDRMANDVSGRVPRSAGVTVPGNPQMYQVGQEVPPEAQAAIDRAFGNTVPFAEGGKGVGEAAAYGVGHLFGEAGGVAAGLYGGAKSLLQGGSFLNGYQNSKDAADSYLSQKLAILDPQSDVGKQIINNVMPLPGKATAAVGGAISSATGDPMAGLVAETAGNVGMAAIGLRKAGAVAKAEETSPATAAQPTSAPAAANAPVAGPAQFSVASDVPFTVDRTLPVREQTERAAVLSRVGMPQVRTSAISGDANEAATDWQLSRLNEPAGKAADAVFEGERNALTNFATQQVQRTGGSLGMDEDALYNRGKTIVGPLDAFQDSLEQQRRGLYAAADARSGGMPSVQPQQFGDLLGRDSAFAGMAEKQSLRSGVQSYLREQGLMDSQGNISPMTAQQAEGVRQYINGEWQPKTSGLAGKLKGALDQDVLSGAGEDVYGAARGLHQQIAQTFDNPGGIAKLMDTDPRTPSNRSVDYEDAPNFVARMSSDDLQHLIGVYKSMPPDLQPQAQAALAEIKAQFANRVLAAGSKTAGQWNAKGVTTELQNNSRVYQQLFSPDELQAFSDLNDAGHILKVRQGYPGASVQQANILRRGAMTMLPTAGAGIGGFAGSLVGLPGGGAAVGSAVGQGIAAKVGERAALKDWQKRMTTLSDLLGPQP